MYNWLTCRTPWPSWAAVTPLVGSWRRLIVRNVSNSVYSSAFKPSEWDWDTVQRLLVGASLPVDAIDRVRHVLDTKLTARTWVIAAASLLSAVDVVDRRVAGMSRRADGCVRDRWCFGRSACVPSTWYQLGKGCMA